MGGPKKKFKSRGLNPEGDERTEKLSCRVTEKTMRKIKYFTDKKSLIRYSKADIIEDAITLYFRQRADWNAINDFHYK